MKCPECKMMYVEESPGDRRLHRAYHDQIVNGVPARPVKSEKIVWRKNGDRIIVVNADSPKRERIRAAKVGRVANTETLYDFGLYDEDEPPDERGIHLFVYCSWDRAVGLSILERRTGVCHYTWEEFDRSEEKTLEEQDAIWSLAFIWVHKKHRRRGIAKILLTEALCYLGVQLDDVGLYTPFSDDGEAFARFVFRDGFFIAK